MSGDMRPVGGMGTGYAKPSTMDAAALSSRDAGQGVVPPLALLHWTVGSRIHVRAAHTST